MSSLGFNFIKDFFLFLLNVTTELLEIYPLSSYEFLFLDNNYRWLNPLINITLSEGWR
jgi:hypothetical protein